MGRPLDAAATAPVADSTAGAGRQMADGDGDPNLVGQDLQFALPKTHPYTIAAAAIGGDQQSRGVGITDASEFVPPAPNTFDGKSRCVMGDAEIDPSGIGRDVIDTVGHDLAEFGNDEIVHPDRLRITLEPQLPAAILEVADKLLLLGIDRDRRLAGSLEGGYLGVDVLELGVTVGMAGPFARLGIGLQAEAQA